MDWNADEESAMVAFWWDIASVRYRLRVLLRFFGGKSGIRYLIKRKIPIHILRFHQIPEGFQKRLMRTPWLPGDREWLKLGKDVF